MSGKEYVLETEYQKCVTECEFWSKGEHTIERALLWRYGKVIVSGGSKKEIENLIRERDSYDRVCITDKFDLLDKKLQDCVSDDLYCPEEMSEKESKRLSKLFQKDAEAMFENEGWEIEDTKIYFEANIKVSIAKKFPL